MKTVKVRAELFCKMVLAAMGISKVADEMLENDNGIVVYTCDVVEQNNMVMKNVATIFSNPRISGSMGKEGWKKTLCMELQYDLEENSNGVKYLMVEKPDFEGIVGMIVNDLLGVRCNAEMEVSAVDQKSEQSIYSAIVTLKYDCKMILDIDKFSMDLLSFIGMGVEIVVDGKDTLRINIY